MPLFWLSRQLAGRCYLLVICGTSVPSLGTLLTAAEQGHRHRTLKLSVLHWHKNFPRGKPDFKHVLLISAVSFSPCSISDTDIRWKQMWTLKGALCYWHCPRLSLEAEHWVQSLGSGGPGAFLFMSLYLERRAEGRGSQATHLGSCIRTTYIWVLEKSGCWLWHYLEPLQGYWCCVRLLK